MLTDKDDDAHQSVPLLHPETGCVGVQSPARARQAPFLKALWPTALEQLLHPDSPQSGIVGMVLYAFSTVCVALMSTCAKLLGEEGVPVFEVVLARGLLMVLCVIPMLINSGVDPRGNRRVLLLLRGTLGFGSVSSMFWAINLLPLSDATVLSFLAPVCVAISAPLLLNETPSRTVLLSLPVCLVGVVLVARPTSIFGGHSLSKLGVAIGIMQAAFSATAKMSVRELRRSEPDAVIIFWMASINSAGAALFCGLLPHHVRMPSGGRQWLLLLGTGVAGFGNQVTLTMALRRCAATPALAMSYLAVLWGLLLGTLLFGEHPTWTSLLGAGLICASTLALSLLQARAKAKAKCDSPGAGSSASRPAALPGEGGLLGQGVLAHRFPEPAGGAGYTAEEDAKVEVDMVLGGVMGRKGSTELAEVVVAGLQRRPTAGANSLPLSIQGQASGALRRGTSDESEIAARR